MRRSVLLAILVGGGAAGLLDILMAMYDFSWRVPRAIAGGLLGPRVFEDESWSVWSLGLCLHFFITCVAAAVYWLASTKLPFLRKRPGNTSCIARLISARTECRRVSTCAAAVLRADARA